mmetsp:Transcript_49016/g.81548  ORF Transcript_49016/g.81548 Transcript_49016/m.81548 type:complete len:122 (-) Transcript_49016:8-373(-)
MIRRFLSTASKMSIQARITEKIQASLDPLHLEVINESHMHNVAPGSESHFRVVIVSEKFEGKTKLDQHRMVHEAVEIELRDHIHAFSAQTLKPSQWEAQGHNIVVQQSPSCRGGMKTEQSK